MTVAFQKRAAVAGASAGAAPGTVLSPFAVPDEFGAPWGGQQGEAYRAARLLLTPEEREQFDELPPKYRQFALEKLRNGLDPATARDALRAGIRAQEYDRAEVAPPASVPSEGADGGVWAERSQVQAGAPEHVLNAARSAVQDDKLERNKQWTSYWDSSDTQRDYAPTMGRLYALDQEAWPSDYAGQRSSRTAELGRAWDRAVTDAARVRAIPGYDPQAPTAMRGVTNPAMVQGINQFLTKQRSEGQNAPGISDAELADTVYNQDPVGWRAREQAAQAARDSYAKQTPYRYVQSNGRSLDPEQVSPADVEGQPRAVIQATNAEQEARLRQMRLENQRGPAARIGNTGINPAGLTPDQAARLKDWQAPTSVAGSPAQRRLADRYVTEAETAARYSAADPATRQQMFDDAAAGAAFHQQNAESFNPQIARDDVTRQPIRNERGQLVTQRQVVQNPDGTYRPMTQEDRRAGQLKSLGEQWAAQRQMRAAQQVDPKLRSTVAGDQSAQAAWFKRRMEAGKPPEQVKQEAIAFQQAAQQKALAGRPKPPVRPSAPSWRDTVTQAASTATQVAGRVADRASGWLRDNLPKPVQAAAPVAASGQPTPMERAGTQMGNQQIDGTTGIANWENQQRMLKNTAPVQPVAGTNSQAPKAPGSGGGARRGPKGI